MVDGTYKFDASRLTANHNRCLLEFMRGQHELVVVDNTNVRLYEIAPYYRLAEASGEILWTVADLETCTCTAYLRRCPRPSNPCPRGGTSD